MAVRKATPKRKPGRQLLGPDRPPGGGGGGGVNINVPPPPSSATGGSSSSSSGGGGGGSSSGGGSSGGASASEGRRLKNERQAKMNRLAAFRTTVQALGIDETRNLTKLIRKSAKNEFSGDRFMLFLRRTKEYKGRFPTIGKLGPGGTRLSENDYMQLEADYTLEAKQIGLSLTRVDVSRLIKLGVTADQYAHRVQAVGRMQEHRPSFEAFAQLTGIPLDTPKAMLDFIEGLAPQEWYRLWERTSIHSAARSAGLQVGVDIPAEFLEELAANTPGYDVEADVGKFLQQYAGLRHAARQAGFTIGQDLPEELFRKYLKGETDIEAGQFSKLAQSIKTLLPMSAISGFGLTRDDLIELEFGGPRAPELAQQAQKIIADVESRRQNVAATPIVAEQVGRQRAGRPQSL